MTAPGPSGLWLDAFPRTWDAQYERDVPGRAATVVYYPGARRDGGSDGLFVAAGGSPYLVEARDPDSWSRIDRPTARFLEPVGEVALLLDGEVHLRSGDTLHRVDHRHGRTVSEPLSW